MSNILCWTRTKTCTKKIGLRLGTGLKMFASPLPCLHLNLANLVYCILIVRSRSRYDIHSTQNWQTFIYGHQCDCQCFFFTCSILNRGVEMFLQVGQIHRSGPVMQSRSQFFSRRTPRPCMPRPKPRSLSRDQNHL